MGDTTGAPENYFGKNDPAELERIAGRLATQRLYELEVPPRSRASPGTICAMCTATSCRTSTPWAGQLRTGEVGAMGMAMCRAQYVDAVR